MNKKITHFVVNGKVIVRREKVNVWRGNWSKKGNKVFSSCDRSINKSKCDGVMVYGVCQKCGWTHVCSNCDRVRINNTGEWLYVSHDNTKASHGICGPCAEKLYPDVMKILKEKKKNEKALCVS